MRTGRPLRIEMQKWGGRPHWEYDALELGEDEHGRWAGVPVGTPMKRPGAAYVNPTAQVVLFPTTEQFAASVVTVHAPGSPMQLYVDMATPAVWHPRENAPTLVRSIDLDLDVVRGPTGRVWIDDEDEFAEHRVVFGYPDEIVAMATASVAAVHAAVLADRPPFDAASSAGWFDLLHDVVGTRTLNE